MKKLLCILILIWLTAQAFAQSKLEKDTKTIYTYLKVGADGQEIYCGYTIATLYFTNQRIKFDSPSGSVDLQIIVRSRDKWVGQDQYKNEYEVTAFGIEGTLGLLILPVDRTKHLLALAINRNKKLCE